ncbi:MAG: hypothetical protein ACREEP_04560 [Dongiaceae bacterium]
MIIHAKARSAPRLKSTSYFLGAVNISLYWDFLACLAPWRETISGFLDVRGADIQFAQGFLGHYSFLSSKKMSATSSAFDTLMPLSRTRL